MYNKLSMKKFDRRTLSIKSEALRVIERSQFISNTLLAGLIGTGFITGNNPQENFTAGLLTSAAIFSGLVLNKNRTSKEINRLTNEYEELLYEDSQPISEKLLPLEKRTSKPRNFKMHGIKESSIYEIVLGGVCEAGAFIISNSETNNKLIPLLIGAAALTGAGVMDLTSTKMFVEDTRFKFNLTTNKIDNHYGQPTL